MILPKNLLLTLASAITILALPYGYLPSIARDVLRETSLPMSNPAHQVNPIHRSIQADLSRRNANFYVVISGDTGYSLAARWSTTYAVLSAANPTVNWNSLFIGQSLQMPSLRKPIAYTTIAGDTGISIATSNGILLQDLQAANPTVDFTNLANSEQIQIPGYGTKSSYTVIAGDIGNTIAPAFGLPFSSLSDANPGVNWKNLQIGQILQVPAGSSPSYPNATTTTSTATSTTIAVGSSITISATSTSLTSAITSSTSSSATSSTTTLTSSTTQLTLTTTSTVPSPEAVSTVNDDDSQIPAQDQYIFYSGNGSPSAGWPEMNSWSSFSSLWAANLPIIGTNCVGGVAPNTAAETQQVRDAIEAIAATSQLDHRFILAVMMQESNGCVRVPTTLSAIHNPGLMQDHDGTGTCNTGYGGALMPCPQANIAQMILDGVMGTASGDGLVQTISEAATQNQAVTQTYYMAARIYNSGLGGSVFSDLGAGGSTHCYVSDIANRLTGWVLAPRQCMLDTY